MDAGRPLRPAPRRVLDTVAALAEQHGYPPTVREIGAVIGLSATTVWTHLRTLTRTGMITHDRAVPRGITVTDLGQQHLTTRSEPVAWVRQHPTGDGTVTMQPFPASFTSPGSWMHQADSPVVAAGIQAGDWLICEPVNPNDPKTTFPYLAVVRHGTDVTVTDVRAPDDVPSVAKTHSKVCVILRAGINGDDNRPSTLAATQPASLLEPRNGTP